MESFIDILVKAAGEGFEWLQSAVSIVIKATPLFGVPVMVLLSSFIVLFLGWNLLNER